MNPVSVLLVVDVQNDFIDGTLALKKCGYGQDGAEVIEPINQLLRVGRWDKVIYTQDWHPENHISFFENLALRELHPESKVFRQCACLIMKFNKIIQIMRNKCKHFNFIPFKKIALHIFHILHLNLT